MRNVIVFFVLFFITIAVKAQWEQTNYPAGDLPREFCTDIGKIYSGSKNGNIYQSDDYGQSWTTLKSNLYQNEVIYAIAAKDNIILASTSSYVFISIDYGVTWTQTLSPPSYGSRSITINGVNLYVGTGYALGGGAVYLSVNSGQNWSNITNFSPPLQLAAGGVMSIVANGSLILAGTVAQNINFAGIYRSTNSGLTWSKSNGIDSNLIYSLIQLDNIYFAGTDCIFKSTDNGATWVASNNGIPSCITVSFATYGNIVFAGATNGNIFMTTDSGANWSSIKENLPVTTNSVSDILICGNFIFANLNNSGFWRRSLPEITTTCENKYHSFIKLYPNPAINVIHLETGNVTNNSKMKVYNINAQVILEQLLQNKKTDIDISNLKSGVYFVKVQNDETTKVLKFFKK